MNKIRIQRNKEKGSDFDIMTILEEQREGVRLYKEKDKEKGSDFDIMTILEESKEIKV